MLMTQARSRSTRHAAGFSMIDVLVAIVVLATALLALAALQGALTRNSADARARSQIAAYSEGLIDQLRAGSYDSIASATISPVSGGTTQQTEAYNAQLATGVSNLKTVVTSTEYYGVTAGTGGAFSTSVPSNLASYTPRYKHVNVTTTWTDASGQARTQSFDTLVSPLTIEGDNSLASQSLAISGAATPIVREYNPGATAGVIPIAIGDTQQTAATNPKPQILALNGNKTAVVGTSFNVLTYQTPDSNSNAVIQKRVDTLVIECGCAYAGEANAAVTTDANTAFSSLLAQPYRPTYWDGTQYVEPDAVSGQTTSTTQVDTSKTQSSYCDVCCRDHNDATGDTVKFDPWTTDYNHYQYVNGSLALATTGTFLNACRLIRVEGQYRVATDLNNYFFGLLATQTMPDAPGTTAIPDSTSTDCSDPENSGVSYVTCYQDFIKKYLANSITTLAAGGSAISATAAATLYDDYDLNNPTDISISASSTAYRYLHARGLYIDHLEDDALKKINNAISNCTYTDVSNCYLPLLPFTTINATELAVWAADTGGSSILQVFDNAQNSISGDPSAPIRGYATAAAGATAGQTTDSVAKLTLSNSGVAVGNPVDMDDETTTSDSQPFTILGSNSGSIFTVSLGGDIVSSNGSFTNYTSTTAPITSYQLVGGNAITCVAKTSLPWKSPDPYTCETINTTLANTSLNVIVEKYNVILQNSQQNTNPCDTSGAKITTFYCVNYQVDSSAVKVNGTSVTPTISVLGTDGSLSEVSSVGISGVNPNSSITINLKQQSTTNPATAVCSGTAVSAWTCP